MRKFLFGAVMLTSSACGPLAADVGEDLPDSFYISERIISLVETFDLESDTKKLGSVTKRFFSFTTHFDYLGPNLEKIAEANAEFFSFGTVAHIFDAREKEIGRIEEVLFTWLSPAKYRIFDHTNRLIAIARMNFWGTQFVISDPVSQNEIAVIHRPWLRFWRDAWTVDILNNKAIDPRLMVFIAVYQTDAEARKRELRSSEEEERQNEEKDGIRTQSHYGLFSPSKEEALLQDLGAFDYLADDQIMANWQEHEKEYEEKLSPFTAKILSHLSSHSLREKSSPVKKKEFEKQYLQLQREHFRECLNEGIHVLKDPNVSYEQKSILYNLLHEMKREKFEQSRGRGI